MSKLLILVVLIFLQFSTFAQWEAYILRNDIHFNATTENFLVLNNFDKPLPEVQQQLYLLADSILKNKVHGSYADLAQNLRFADFCIKNNIILLGGPLLGNVTINGVSVWFRSAKPAKFMVKVKNELDEKQFGPVYSNYQTDLSAVLKIEGLKANTNYDYEVYVDDIKIQSTNPYSFKTLSFNSADDTRIVFGSCMHRLGLGNEKLSSAIIARNPNALVLMGDIAANDRNNHTGLHSLDYLMRDLFPAWQRLVAVTPVYMTWDDHDYFDNDLFGIPPGFTKQDKQNVWNVFKHAWNNPMYGLDEKDNAVYLRTRIQSADIIMLDNRSMRTQNSLLGDKQMKWLEEQLIDCKGPFIILSCGTMWSDYLSDGKDSWGAFDKEGREKIFSLIEKNNIKGVLLISGDRHGARGFTIPRNNGFQFYEFGAASMGGLFGPPETKPEWQTQLYGFSNVYAFGEFTFDESLPNPMVTFRLIDENSTILKEIILKRSDLTPKK
jgi:alkaline phosphatase D